VAIATSRLATMEMVPIMLQLDQLFKSTTISACSRERLSVWFRLKKMSTSKGKENSLVNPQTFVNAI